MPQHLTLCTCDPEWAAYAVCPTCEKRRLEARLAARGLLVAGDDMDARDAEQQMVDQASAWLAEHDAREASERGARWFGSDR